MKTLTILLFSFLIQSSFAQTRSVTLPALSFSKLDNYIGSYISLYVVNAGNFVGTEPTIKKVFNIVNPMRINDTSFVIPATQVASNTSNSFIVPNYLVVVIHSSPDHALNRYPVANRFFAQPEYVTGLNPAEPSVENKLFQYKQAIPLTGQVKEVKISPLTK